MKIAGIIAEYNPFHNGHLYQIEKTKELGATHIVTVMSPDFVQRGDASCFDKWARANAALLNGIDLVAELPVQYALASANIFAQASVNILAQLGVEIISFGSEIGDINKLKDVANMCEEIKQNDFMQNELKKGISYPAAQTNTIAKLYGQEYAHILTSPNNILGIEYIRAINSICPHITPVTIKRCVSLHDDNKHGKCIASASYIRENFKKSTLRRYTPINAYKIYRNELSKGKSPVNKQALQTAMLYKLKTMSKNEILLLPDVSEGLENRIFNSARAAATLEEFYKMVKTKRYTLAKIRRIAFCALIGINKQSLQRKVQFIRILGANQNGLAVLKKAKETSNLPISTKFMTLSKLSQTDIDITVKATDIYSLLLTLPQKGGRDFTNNCIIIKNK